MFMEEPRLDGLTGLSRASTVIGVFNGMVISS